MAGSERFRVFLSAVSSELGAARSLVASDLRARGLEVKVQEDFRQEADSDTTLAKLHDYIRDCSAVVAIVGSRSGSVPQAAAEPFREMLPDGLDRASYTQWEVLFARNHGRRLSLYHSTDAYEPDQPAPDGDDADLQDRFVRWLFVEKELDRGEFGSAHELGRLVLREDWPRLRTSRSVVLPYPSLGELFQGRAALLDEVRAGLTDAPDVTETTRLVLHGLGGVGKTRLAVEYGWRHLDDYSAVLFVSGETPALLSQGLAELCGPHALDLSQREATEEEIQVAAVVAWLAESQGWLLIFDNLDTDEAARAAEALLPRLYGGHVLMTSQLGDWGADVECLEVDVLGEADASRFLLDRTDQRRRRVDTDEADARELAQELGGLALALEQAGAYVSQRRRSLAQYLAGWRSKEASVRAWHDERVMNCPRNVAVTCQTTIDRLTAPERALLRLLAWMAPEPVPLFVLESDAATTIFGAACELLEPVGDAEPSPLDALAGLAGFSMARWDADADTVTLHRVVQSIVRDRIGSDGAVWVTKALELLDAARPGSPGDVRTWRRWEALRPHVAVSIGHADAAAVAEPTSTLMSELGHLLYAKALHREAEPLMRRALAIAEASYGPDHPDVSTRLDNLAQMLQATNRLGEAEPLMRRALAIDEASYGPHHGDVATRLNNLAQLLVATNRLGEAEPLMRRTLVIDEASYGSDHPEVARGLNNLALLLQATNRLGEAEPLMRRALVIDEASYGADHPVVAADLNNLAQLLVDTDRLGEAEPLMRRALVIDESSYGEDHPDVAIRLNNLAQLLKATDRLGEAEPLMRRALVIDEASYGADHPVVAADLNNLAQLLVDTDRLGEAEPLMRRALAIDESSYGEDHPDVARDLNNLAQLLVATGRLGEAEPLMRRVVEILVAFTATTGHEHPHLRAALGNYETLMRAMGRDEEEIVEALRQLDPGGSQGNL